MAALLDTGAQAVRRYEQARRLPSLQTALAYEAVFGVPVAELFPGLYAVTRKAVRMRARRRAGAPASARTAARQAYRTTTLVNIAAR